MSNTEKEWKDCPVCGAKNSMYWMENKDEIFRYKDILIEIKDLRGQFCRMCLDGFWDGDSNRKIQEAIQKAKQGENI